MLSSYIICHLELIHTLHETWPTRQIGQAEVQEKIKLKAFHFLGLLFRPATPVLETLLDIEGQLTVVSSFVNYGLLPRKVRAIVPHVSITPGSPPTWTFSHHLNQAETHHS